jgi:hypothetical protein
MPRCPAYDPFDNGTGAPLRLPARSSAATPIRLAPVVTSVVDVHETPAVPPEVPGGDERAGYFLGGALLIFLGWGMGVFVNFLLHLMAGTSGMTLGGVRITSTLGPYAWALVGFGLFTGALGVVLIALGRASPKGPVILPGYPY